MQVRSTRVVALATLVTLIGCGTAGKRTAIGGGAGAALGAGIGALAGGKKGALIGAGVGALAGGSVGLYLDKQHKELEKVAEAKRTENGILVNMKNDILFDTSSAELKDEAVTQITQVGDILAKYADNRIRIEGHTDSSGSDSLNETLSRKRADSVRTVLVSAACARAITVVGNGETKPIADNATKEGRAKNRRVEVHIDAEPQLARRESPGSAREPARPLRAASRSSRSMRAVGRRPARFGDGRALPAVVELVRARAPPDGRTRAAGVRTRGCEIEPQPGRSFRLARWKDTCATLHMWTQIVGKVRLALTPLVNHWWNVPLYVTARGLTTSVIPTGTAGSRSIRLHRPTAEITPATGDAMLSLAPRRWPTSTPSSWPRCATSASRSIIWTMPVEVPIRSRSSRTTAHASYDPEYAQRFWRILALDDRVFTRVPRAFIGKCSPVHFFWGSFDLAVTRFSGRPRRARGRGPDHARGVLARGEQPRLLAWGSRGRRRRRSTPTPRPSRRASRPRPCPPTATTTASCGCSCCPTPAVPPTPDPSGGSSSSSRPPTRRGRRSAPGIAPPSSARIHRPPPRGAHPEQHGGARCTESSSRLPRRWYGPLAGAGWMVADHSLTRRRPWWSRTPGTTGSTSAMEAMDHDHHLQIGLVSAFVNAVEQGRPWMARRLADQLLSYSVVHFGSEEPSWRRAPSPSVTPTREHGAFLDQMRELQRAFASGEEELAATAALDLRTGLAAHMNAADRRLASHVSLHCCNGVARL